jgi:SAM-dependent methyltransferase
MADFSELDVFRDGRNIHDGYYRGAGLELGTLYNKIERDADYQEAVTYAANRSITTPNRLLNLFLLIKYHLPKLPFGDIIEFGAYKGGTAFFMGALARRLLPGVKVYALDTFKGMPPTDKDVDAHIAGDFSDTSLEEVLSIREQYGLHNVHFIKGTFEETAPIVLHSGNKIRLAHIDCDIFSSVKFAYDIVKPHMVARGYFVFDDSTAATCIGATEAVERFVIQRDGLLSEQIFPHHVFRAPCDSSQLESPQPLVNSTSRFRERADQRHRMQQTVSATSLYILPTTVHLWESSCLDYVAVDGFSQIEPGGMWTDGHEARICFRKPRDLAGDLLIMFQLLPAIYGGSTTQVVHVAVNGSALTTWTLTDPRYRWLPLMIDRALVQQSDVIEVAFSIPTCIQPSATGPSEDPRFLGIMLHTLSWEDTDRARYEGSFLSHLGRPVGEEARKSYDQKILSGFWSRFITGPRVLDIGFVGQLGLSALPIFEGAIGVDLDYPGYDGRILPFETDSQDAVFSSHCLEHIPDHIKAIQEWHRVTKVGGHIITLVPHAFLYERRKRPPSRWAETHHLRFYTPMSLLAEFEAALPPNSYRVRHLADNDLHYDYSASPDTHPVGCYEIELVIEKVRPPIWMIED